MPPAQAQAQAKAQVQPQLDKQIDKIEQQSAAQRKQLDRAATDPRLQDLKTTREDVRREEGHRAAGELGRHRGGAERHADHGAVGPRDRGSRRAPARRHDPEGDRGKDMTADVGGTTAGYVDLAAEISSRLVITIGVVVGLSFLLLMLAFRSV